jgi:hypothetical protein
MTEDAPLVDASEISLEELADPDANPALDRSLRRLLTSLDDPNGIISAFNSFASS